MECMDDASEKRRNACAARTDCDADKLQAPPEPEIIGLYPSPEDPVAVIVKNAFHSSEGMALEDLKRCIQKHHGRSLVEHRPFAYGVDGQEHKGGNDCTFLGGFLQFFAPGVAAQVKRVGHLAWETAQWGDMEMDHYSGTNKPYKDPMKAGIRTSGHLSYKGWDELGPHSDSESLYTVLLHLSSPLDYDGGEIYMYPHNRPHTDKERLLVKPDRYSALVFLSDENHGVQKISNGLRQTVSSMMGRVRCVVVGKLRNRMRLTSIVLLF
jgi:hypothetical protein